MKRCTKCGIEKPEESFEMQPSRGRRRSECRDCRRIAGREWLAKRKANPPQKTVESKKCARCQEVKPTSEFSPANPGYFHRLCRNCENEVRREKREMLRKNDPNGLYYRAFTNKEGIEVKRCSRCHAEKPLSEFYGNTATRIHSRCKDCDKAIKKEHYDADPEKYRKEARDYAASHPEERRERFRQWDSAHREYRNRYQSMRWHLLTQEERQARGARRSEYNRQWGEKNREHKRMMTRLWQQNNPHKFADKEQRRRARKRNAPRIERIDRLALIERDKWTCYLCMQICTPNNVTLDHVIPLYHGGTHTADNLRVACRTCNSRKGRKLLKDFLK